MKNRIRQFIEKRGITRYRFWQDTGLGRDTAYRMCNDPGYILTKSALDKICSAYRVQPGEFLEWLPDSSDENRKTNALASEAEESNKQSGKSFQSFSSSSPNDLFVPGSAIISGEQKIKSSEMGLSA